MKKQFDINRLIFRSLKGHNLTEEEAEYLNGYERKNNKLYELPDALQIRRQTQISIERFKKEFGSKPKVICLPSYNHKDNFFLSLFKKTKSILLKCFGK